MGDLKRVSLKSVRNIYYVLRFIDCLQGVGAPAIPSQYNNSEPLNKAMPVRSNVTVVGFVSGLSRGYSRKPRIVVGSIEILLFFSDINVFDKHSDLRMQSNRRDGDSKS